MLEFILIAYSSIVTVLIVACALHRSPTPIPHKHIILEHKQFDIKRIIERVQILNTNPYEGAVIDNVKFNMAQSLHEHIKITKVNGYYGDPSLQEYELEIFIATKPE